MTDPFWFPSRARRAIARSVLGAAIVASLTLIKSERPVGAAEIGCVTAGLYETIHLPDDYWARNWPSGVRPAVNTCSLGFLRGEIAKGDFDKVVVFYRNNHPFLQSIDLLSPGGDVQEAIKIGRLFRKYLVSTDAPHGRSSYGVPVIGFPNDPFFCKGTQCICASACALVWFGGVYRDGEVGLHRPRIEDSQFKALPPAEAGIVYRRVLEELEAYLHDMEVPHPIVDVLVATGSSDIQWVETGFDKDENNLQRPASYAEWEDAICGTFTREQAHIVVNLMARETGPAPTFTRDETLLTADELSELKSLVDKEYRHDQCQRELRNRQADTLPMP